MCAIVGFVGDPEQGLVFMVGALSRGNHRGHEAVGISSSGKPQLHFRSQGYVRDACHLMNPEFTVFQEMMQTGGRNHLIGHVRYATVGASNLAHVQPLTLITPRFGEITFVHNGELVGYARYREELVKAGYVFRSESDSEVLAALLARAPVDTLSEAVEHVIKTVAGAYSFLVLGPDAIYGARDYHGIRPLHMATVAGGIALGSEAGIIGESSGMVEIPPGAMVVLRKNEEPVLRQIVPAQPRHCLLEAIYFARPDQELNGKVAGDFRLATGIRLAQTHPVEADLVCAVLDSGQDAAQGYAMQSSLPYQPRAIMKNIFQVPGRSFILGSDLLREAAAKAKYSPTPLLVAGKRVIVVDDSIVRGTTARAITSKLLAAGALEVHWRVASPPVKQPCFYGIDISDSEELIAAHQDEDAIARAIGADSIRYLALEDISEIAKEYGIGWCDACFSGNYPIPIR